MKKFLSLKGKNLFREVASKGRRYYRCEAQLIAIKSYKNQGTLNNNYQNIKIGIQIGKKYGNAVARNHAKRRIRAICCEISHGFKGDFSVIIRPGNDFKSLNYFDSKKLIDSLFKEAGIVELKNNEKF